MKKSAVLLLLTAALWLAVSFGTAGEALAPAGSELERFDVAQGAVVSRIPSTPELQAEAGKLLQSLSKAKGLFRADPKDGTVLRIPLQPSQEVKQPGFYAFAAEMYVFLPLGQDPYILLFSEENEPRLFGFDYPVDRLLTLCGWKDARP
ncbi:hypothetical protein [Gorillibacterium sp. sgz5001074]|uniref:hypothetical protein n=1 Tax=Gorillibacterium sp. sgz5001074 TaxID=3446695 RepID=UPI003F66BA15